MTDGKVDMVIGNEHEFAKAFRGYDTGEVDSFIESLEEKIRALENDNVNYAERAAAAKAELDDSNTKRGLAEKELAQAQEEAARILDEARASAELIKTEAKKKAEKIEADAKLKADATIGAALLEEKRVNERLEKSIVEKERLYNAICDKHNEFKKTVFALYAEHISSLEGIIAGRVPESFGVPEKKTGEPAPSPKKEEVVREEMIAPVVSAAQKSEPDTIKVSRESGRGETVSSIMRELDEIKSRMAEKKNI